MAAGGIGYPLPVRSLTLLATQGGEAITPAFNPISCGPISAAAAMLVAIRLVSFGKRLWDSAGSLVPGIQQ